MPTSKKKGRNGINSVREHRAKKKVPVKKPPSSVKGRTALAKRKVPKKSRNT